MSKLWIGKKLYSVENEVRDHVEQLEKQLEDIKLELSTPETMECASKNEPLYKWAALIVCENHRLKKELQVLKGGD